MQFIGIGMNSAEEILSWTEKLGVEVNYPLLVGAAEAFALGSRYGNREGVLPYTIIIDLSGCYYQSTYRTFRPVTVVVFTGTATTCCCT